MPAILRFFGEVVALIWLGHLLVARICKGESRQRLPIEFLRLLRHLAAVQALEAAEVEELHGELYVRHSQLRLPEPSDDRLARLRV